MVGGVAREGAPPGPGSPCGDARYRVRGVAAPVVPAAAGEWALQVNPGGWLHLHDVCGGLFVWPVDHGYSVAWRAGGGFAQPRPGRNPGWRVVAVGAGLCAGVPLPRPGQGNEPGCPEPRIRVTDDAGLRISIQCPLHASRAAGVCGAGRRVERRRGPPLCCPPDNRGGVADGVGKGSTVDWNSSWAQGSRALAALRWSWL